MKTLTMILTLLAALGAGAQQEKYTTFTLGPNAHDYGVTVSTINDSGQVLGWWPNSQAYVLSPGGVWTKNIIKAKLAPLTMNNAATIIGIEAPGNIPFIKKWGQDESRGPKNGAFSRLTNIYSSINTAGYIAGTAEIDPHTGQTGLYLSGGVVLFPHDQYPHEQVSVALGQAGLNNLNQVVGVWNNYSTPPSGFFYDVNSKQLNTTFNVPGAVYTFPTAINDNQEVVGSWEDQNFVGHGFYWNATAGFSDIDIPGDTEMYLVGINNQSVILGWWWDANTPRLYHMVTLVNGQTTASINVPQSVPGSTVAVAINNVGQVVGEYETQEGVWRGFIYTPSK
jgi:probable HAF family extracellular repeat protein